MSPNTGEYIINSPRKLILLKSVRGVIKQGGHKGVDNWPWPGGHSTLSSSTLFMVDY
jgi:hypothetical protein